MTISPPQVAVYVWLNYDFSKSGIARQNYMKYLNSKNIASIIVNKCYIFTNNHKISGFLDDFMQKKSYLCMKKIKQPKLA